MADRLAKRDDQTPLPIPVGQPAAIWHSPLRRAAATARFIADQQPPEVAVRAHDGLTELAQGAWEGQLATDVRTRWAPELAAWRRSPHISQAPGGEPLADAARRVRDALSTILAELAPEHGSTEKAGSDAVGGRAAPAYDPVPGYPTAVPVADALPEPWAVVVAHDGIFRLTMLTLLGMPLSRFWALPFNLCGISVVAIHEGVAALRAHNLSEHLAPLAEEERAAKEARGERRGAL